VALNLLSTTDSIEPTVAYIHQFVDMTQVTVQTQYTGLKAPVDTCNAALGDSFAAGTTDGPGDFDFTQGSNSSQDNPFWNILGDLITEPPLDQIACHYPKPILLYTGGVSFPAAWTPSILPLQIFQIGHLFILGVPGEFTTMSGRRLRNAVLSVVQPKVSNAVVVIAGLANGYSQYVATPEEYSVQRYEGASTLFGPNTLPAYIQLYSNLANQLVNGGNVPPGPTPTDWTDYEINILPGPEPDVGIPGTVYIQPNANYSIGSDVMVVFVSADPRNNFKTQDSYLYIQRLISGTWTTVAVDGDWETKFTWQKPGWESESYATIIWDTSNAVPGSTYRIVHSAVSYTGLPFTGITKTFIVS